MPALLRATALFLGLFFLSACLEESQGTPESEFIFPDLLSEQRLECERDGGRWGASPKGGSTCYRNLSDAGKQCTGENDCQGVCLARSRTCSPITPFFGCHEVLSSTGIPQTLCLE